VVLEEDEEEPPTSACKQGKTSNCRRSDGCDVYTRYRISEANWPAFIAGCSELGWKAVVAVFLVTSATIVCMLASFPLMVGSGLIFQQKSMVLFLAQQQAASVCEAMWAGSLMACQLGRCLCRKYTEEELHKTQVVNGIIDQQEWRMVVLTRGSQLLPAEVFNYVVSLTTLSLTDYALGCVCELSLFFHLTGSGPNFQTQCTFSGYQFHGVGSIIPCIPACADKVQCLCSR